MTKFRCIAIIAICLLQTNSIFAQQTILRGLVTDESGSPVSGASIMIKGKLYFGTMTDNTGHFVTRIDISTDTMIRCTHVGYQDLFQKINRNNYLALSLKRSADLMQLSPISDTITYSKNDLPLVKISESDRSVNEFLDAHQQRIFTRVEIDASFPGGKDGLHRYIKSHLKFSDSAFNSNTNGIVKIGFTVAKDGSVTNATVLSGINKYYDNAILTLISGMPKWTPAIQNGRIVSVYKELLIPVNIAIQIR